MRNLILGACCLSLLSSCGNIGGGALSGASLGAVVGSAIGGIVGGAHGSDLGTLVGAAAGAAGGAAVVSAAEKKSQRSDGEIVEYNDAAEYRSSEENIKLQWFMMVITVFSLIVALCSINGNAVISEIQNIIEWIKTYIL